MNHQIELNGKIHSSNENRRPTLFRCKCRRIQTTGCFRYLNGAQVNKQRGTTKCSKSNCPPLKDNQLPSVVKAPEKPSFLCCFVVMNDFLKRLSLLNRTTNKTPAVVCLNGNKKCFGDLLRELFFFLFFYSIIYLFFFPFAHFSGENE